MLCSIVWTIGTAFPVTAVYQVNVPPSAFPGAWSTPPRASTPDLLAGPDRQADRRPPPQEATILRRGGPPGHFRLPRFLRQDMCRRHQVITTGRRWSPASNEDRRRMKKMMVPSGRGQAGPAVEALAATWARTWSRSTPRGTSRGRASIPMVGLGRPGDLQDDLTVLPRPTAFFHPPGHQAGPASGGRAYGADRSYFWWEAPPAAI